MVDQLTIPIQPLALLALLWLTLWPLAATGQDLDFTATRAVVDFSSKLQTWDGFGFNYVETAQTMDYAKGPQEYGGFSLLKEEDRQKIVDLVFGDDGLRVGLLKMFYDPFHQVEPGGKFDHKTTTQWLRYFAREGLKKTRAGGRDLTIITTLYGPPAYMTKQKVMRGRDLDPAHQRDLVRYLVNWVKFLREQEGLLVNNGTPHPDAFVLINLGKTKKVNVRVKGSAAKAFTAFRTTEDQQETFARTGSFALTDGTLVYELPGGSVTTFFANDHRNH